MAQWAFDAIGNPIRFQWDDTTTQYSDVINGESTLITKGPENIDWLTGAEKPTLTAEQKAAGYFLLPYVSGGTYNALDQWMPRTVDYFDVVPPRPENSPNWIWNTNQKKWEEPRHEGGWKEELSKTMELVVVGLLSWATGGTVGAAFGGGMAGSIAGGAASGAVGSTTSGNDMATGMLAGAAGGAIVGGIAGEGVTTGADADAALMAENSFDSGAMAQSVGYTPPASSMSTWMKAAGEVAGQVGKESKTLTEIAGTLGALSGMSDALKTTDGQAASAPNDIGGTAAPLDLTTNTNTASDGAMWAVGLGLAALFLN